VPVFDDSVFTHQPDDYFLLRDGHVHLFRHDWARERLVADLAALGYLIVTADVAACRDAEDVRRAVIGAVPGWPAGGEEEDDRAVFRDALDDHLPDDDHPQIALVLTGFDALDATVRGDVVELLDDVAAAGRRHLLFGRRLLCLVGTAQLDLDLPRLGGELAGWNRHEWLRAHRSGSERPAWIR